MRGIYVLHFDEPLPKMKNPCTWIYGGVCHYVGLSNHVDRRLWEHANYRGAHKTKLACDLGVSWEVTRLNVPATTAWEQLVTKTPHLYCQTCKEGPFMETADVSPPL